MLVAGGRPGRLARKTCAESVVYTSIWRGNPLGRAEVRLAAQRVGTQLPTQEAMWIRPFERSAQAARLTLRKRIRYALPMQEGAVMLARKRQHWLGRNTFPNAT